MAFWRRKLRDTAQGDADHDHEERQRDELYGHLPLDPATREIRVLDLLPGHFGTPLKAELRVLSLEGTSVPAYEALSYAWGTAVHDRVVCLHDTVTLPITDNLYNALQRLRYKRKARTMWVDAICINQRDDADKSHQVRFMSEVYRNATLVAIWVGETPKTRMDTGKQKLLRMYRQFRPAHASSALALDSAWLFQLQWSWALEYALQSTESQWIFRMWTKQEYVCARAANLHFGANVLPLTDTMQLDMSRLLDTSMRKYACKQFWNVFEDMRQLQRRAPVSLLDGVSLLHGAQATDPRDRVYGLLGLLRHEQARYIEVDYTYQCSRVYTQATRAAIVDDDGLMMLEHPSVIYSSRNPELPSWVADLAMESQNEYSFSLQSRTLLQCGLCIEWLQSLIEAGHRARQLTAQDSDSFTLKIVGVELDTIADTVYWSSSTQAQVSIKEAMEACATAIEHYVYTNQAIVSRNTSDEPVLPLILSSRYGPTPTEDAAAEDQSTSHETKRVAKALQLWDANYRKRKQERRGDRHGRLHWTLPDCPDSTDDDPPFGRWEAFIRCYVYAAGRGLALMKTAGGALVLATNEAQRHDRLVLCQGTDWPLVLRKEGTLWRFCGLAFVHGIADVSSVDHCGFVPPKKRGVREYTLV